MAAPPAREIEMGADIHLIVERRVGRENLPGQWIAVRVMTAGIHTHDSKYPANRYANPVARERNYERFAAIAGVRGDGPEPRGLPTDASDTARLLFATEGDHTPSWMSVAEAAPIFAKTELGPLSDGDRESAIYHYFGVCDDGQSPDDYRIVFWFDS